MAIINKYDSVLISALTKIMGVSKAAMKKLNGAWFTAPAYADFYAIPTSSAGISANWNSSLGGSVVIDLINETSEEYGVGGFDAAYTTNNTAGSYWTFALANPTDTPDTTAPMSIVWYMANTDNGTPSATGTQTSLTVELKQGATQIGTWTQDTILAATYSVHTISLTQAQIDSITDFSNLTITVTTVGGGGSPANRRGVGLGYIYMKYKIGTPPTYTNLWDAATWLPSYMTTLFTYHTDNLQTQVETVSTFGSYGTAGWNYATIMAHPNGNMYGIPYYATNILRINPTDDTHGTFGSSYTGNNKWHGACLTRTGDIYCNPRDMSYVLKIQSSEAASSFGNIALAGKSAAAQLAQNECIYAPPWSATVFYKIDTTTDSYTSFGTVSGSSTTKYGGVALSEAGIVYCIPRSNTNVIKIDPTDDSTTTFGSFSTAQKWNFAVLAPNGKIYASPSQATEILCIDTADDSTTTVSCTTGYNQCFLGLNGYIYFTSGNSSLNPIRLNTADNSITYVSAMNSRTSAVKQASTGYVYGSPGTDGTISKFMSAASTVDDQLFNRGHNR